MVKPTYRLHTGARVNAALLTYLLMYIRRVSKKISRSLNIFHGNFYILNLSETVEIHGNEPYGAIWPSSCEYLINLF